jgi:hypothetical protein
MTGLMMLRMNAWGFLAVAVGGALWEAMSAWIWYPPDVLSLIAGGVFWGIGYCFGGWRERVRIDRAG